MTTLFERPIRVISSQLLRGDKMWEAPAEEDLPPIASYSPDFTSFNHLCLNASASPAIFASGMTMAFL